LQDHDPKDSLTALAFQTSDMYQLMLKAMVSLAKDLYSRQPDGSREFQDLVNALQIKFTDENGQIIDATDLLQQIR